MNPSALHRAIRRAVAALLGLLLAVACSSSPARGSLDDIASESTTPSTAASSTALSTTTEPTTTASTTTVPTTTVPTETVVETVPAPELTSVGTITIAETEYEFAFECYAEGAGDVLALGVGLDPVTDEPTEAIVQAFFGQPYVAVVVDGEAVFELAVDRDAELFVQEGAIHGSALRFVAATDASGVGTELGLGNVIVECDGFAPGLPEGYVN